MVIISLACHKKLLTSEDGFLPQPGGAWTRTRQSTGTLIVPAQHLNSDEQLKFYSGMSFFRLPWIVAPASTTARDGLGPLFNSNSCMSCHMNGGRGESLLDDPRSVATVVKLGVLDEQNRAHPHPILGNQLHPRATFQTFGEGSVLMSEEPIMSKFSDGGVIKLRKPKVDLKLTDKGIDREEIRFSVRTAPHIIGMGLLEAINQEAILENSDELDKDADGISGRPSWVLDDLGSRQLGRFGWKASHPSVASQIAAAFRDDMGITNPYINTESCTEFQSGCLRQASGEDPEERVEITKLLFEYVLFSVQHIPPPIPGKLTSKVKIGRDLFNKVGCGSCHTPRFETKAGLIWPYSDMLLHDMGEGLADHLSEGVASGSEWRTPPLWGLGTMKKVSGHTTLLHDGRARNVLEAILWHEGEAATAARRFKSLDAGERSSLIAFVNAL